MKSKAPHAAKHTATDQPADRAAALGEAPIAPLAGGAAKDVALPLPHERDQSMNSVADKPDPVMVQASRDIEAGMVDTDMRATPGLDAHRRAELVPGAGGKPPGKAG